MHVQYKLKLIVLLFIIRVCYADQRLTLDNIYNIKIIKTDFVPVSLLSCAYVYWACPPAGIK